MIRYFHTEIIFYDLQNSFYRSKIVFTNIQVIIGTFIGISVIKNFVWDRVHIFCLPVVIERPAFSYPFFAFNATSKMPGFLSAAYLGSRSLSNPIASVLKGFWGFASCVQIWLGKRHLFFRLTCYIYFSFFIRIWPKNVEIHLLKY